MTKIPPEHTAAKALEHSFRALGDERARARRPQRRPPSRPIRVLVVALASALAVGGVATGTKVFLGDGGAVRPDIPGLKDPDGRNDIAPSDRQLSEASAADPLGKERWGLRTYRSTGGKTCLVVGRVVGGRLGVIQQGQFKELPAHSTGVCNPLSRLHVSLAQRAYSPATSASRTVLYGVVDRTVTRLHILSVTGKATPVRIAPDGTFIVVRAGVRPFRLTQLVIDGSAGRSVQSLGR
ncbi:MAG: hypothetical protein JWR63_3544 [Conexibacter sp.]|nr:hypothetical protein [Conexibacter sp.]